MQTTSQWRYDKVMTSDVRFVLVETTANHQHFVALDLVQTTTYHQNVASELIQITTDPTSIHGMEHVTVC